MLQKTLLLALLATAATAQTPQIDTPPFGNTAKDLKEAWSRSCARWQATVFTKDPATPLHPTQPQFGTVGTWKTLCAQSAALPPEAMLDFFNQNFHRQAVTAKNGFSKFTGYYKPLLQGSPTRTASFSTPLVAMPAHLPTPAPTREQIVKAVRAGSPLYKPLVWLEPVEAYFLHIQGGGTVQLPSGKTLHVGFAGKNGHPYTAIGKYMKEKGYLTGTISAERIKAWLKAHPQNLDEVMFSNQSYIFFRTRPSESPGALGTPLVGGRSLAVDTSFFPLGVPLFIRTTTNHDDKPFKRLMFAQDIGSAIRGGVRGDIYFGHGPQAGEFASDQNSPGQLLALIPNSVSQTATPPAK